MNSNGESPVYLRISRRAQIPDPVKLARYKKSPELGPCLLFFSGGTALRELSRELIHYTHNSIHVITPFDSGGSSAELRKAFRMPAVGDIRNRLMALADQSFRGNTEVFDLFSHRMSKTGAPASLFDELTLMADGRHPLVARIPEPVQKIICCHLQTFLERMPISFDLRGASLGNLILAAASLIHQKCLDAAIYTFSNLVQARGVVRPVVDQCRHLAARLESGETVLGQHRLTGKTTPPITSPVSRLYLSGQLDADRPAPVSIPPKMRDLIRSAELICYPMGSFYSSLIANFLPKGIGEALASAGCPKIYIPNTYPDPESRGLNPTRQTEILLSYLKADAPARIKTKQVLTAVLIDKKRGRYAAPIDADRLAAMGIELIDCSLISRESTPLVDARRLAAVLLALT